MSVYIHRLIIPDGVLRVGSGVGHRQEAFFDVVDLEVFIGKLLTID